MLDLDVPESFGLRHINVLKAEGASEQSLKDYQQWRTERSQIINRGASASISVVRVTELTDEPPAATVSIEKITGAEARSRGRRYGTLVHSILRDVSWDAGNADIERLAALYKIVGAATDDEERHAVTAAAGALAHPLIRRAAASHRCHRELPISLPLPGGRVLEGVIDLAFVEDDRWHVIDYKTDEDVTANRTYYEQQLRWYIHALASLSGMPAIGTLLQV
jgi:ATP-dependent exoDNAse (exonuclease V) beta subunit